MRKANRTSTGAKRDLLREWHQKSLRSNIDDPVSSMATSMDIETNRDISTDGDPQQISIRIREFIHAELELYFGKW